MTQHSFSLFLPCGIMQSGDQTLFCNTLLVHRLQLDEYLFSSLQPLFSTFLPFQLTLKRFYFSIEFCPNFVFSVINFEINYFLNLLFSFFLIFVVIFTVILIFIFIIIFILFLFFIFIFIFTSIFILFLFPMFSKRLILIKYFFPFHQFTGMQGSENASILANKISSELAEMVEVFY